MDSIAIANRLEGVRERIEQACARSGRSAGDVTLIGVTKTFPIETVEAAVKAGVTHLAENRVQELVEKAGVLPGLIRGGSVSWYMIGHLQRNKAKDVIDYADYFHALDSLRLAKELNKRAALEDRIVPCLVQVNASNEESKYGVAPSSTHSFLDGLSRFEHIRVEGLMTIASFVDDPVQVRPQFSHLRRIFETYDSNRNERVAMKYLSMGMSGDFEVAIEEGATHVRIGSAIFGVRE